MEVKTIYVNYDIKRMRPPNLIAFTHENDINTQVIELHLTDGDEPMTLAADYTYTAAIVNSDTKALINDSIDCELNSDGNVLIPIDDLHVRGRQSLKIELTVTDEQGEQVLSLPFPIWVKVSGSILDDAQVTPESKGTVPELLEDAEKALEDAQQAIEDAGDYDNLINKPIIVGIEEPYYSQPITLEGKFYTKFFTFEQREDGNYNVKLRDISGVIINDNSIPYDKLSGSAQKAIFKDYGYYANPPSDLFTNYSHAPASNGVWNIGDTTLAGLPVAKNGRLYNYFNNGERVQFYVTDCTYLDPPGTQQCFMRVQYMGNLGVWQELAFKNDIVSVSSAVVNSNGTITFTMSDGSTVTTTGESVIGESAYQVAVDNGFIGTEQEWLASLKGEQGDAYVLTPQDKTDIANIVLSELPTTQGVQYGNSND